MKMCPACSTGNPAGRIDCRCCGYDLTAGARAHEEEATPATSFPPESAPPEPPAPPSYPPADDASEFGGQPQIDGERLAALETRVAQLEAELRLHGHEPAGEQR